jgi:hypothetical protein
VPGGVGSEKNEVESSTHLGKTSEINCHAGLRGLSLARFEREETSGGLFFTIACKAEVARVAGFLGMAVTKGRITEEDARA